VYVGGDAYPTANNGNYTVAPGKYPYNSGEMSGESSYTFGPIDVSDYSEGIHIIAHAVTCENMTNSNAFMGLEAYPVPFDTEVNLRYSTSFDTDLTIEIYNMTGTLLRSYRIDNHSKNTEDVLQVDLSNTDNQLFLVRMTTNKGVIVKKIVSSSIKKH